MGINFNAEKHEYYTDSGLTYTSVTQLIKQYENEFDPDGFIAQRVAKSRGLQVSEVLEEWERKRSHSSDKGNEFHLAAEKYFLKEKLTTREKEITEDFRAFRKKFITGKVTPELKVYNNFYEVAGTIDAPEEFKHKINLWDYKTNEEIDFSSKYNNFLKGDLSFLEECKYNKYALQLSLYAKLLELQGKRPGKLTILWLDQEYKVHPIPVPYLRHTAELILNNHLECRYTKSA